MILSFNSFTEISNSFATLSQAASISSTSSIFKYAEYFENSLYKAKSKSILVTSLNFDNTCGNVASYMFEVLLLDRSKKNVEVLTYLFNKTEKNFFNPELCIPVLGIVLLLKTGTEDKHIEEIGTRMSNMANDDLQVMLNKLPKDSHHKKIIKKLKNGKSKRS